MSDAPQNPEMTKLKAEIDAYCASHGVSKTAFGLWARNDPSLVSDIESGRELRWGTIRDIRQKMQAAQRGAA